MKIDSSTPANSSSTIFIDDVHKKNISIWILKLLILCLFAGMGTKVVHLFQLSSAKNAQSQLPSQLVKRQNLNISVTANGTIEAERSINLSPKNAGIVKSLLFKEGDVVKKGQIIAYMDDSNLQGQLTQAKAEIASAEANLQKLIAGNQKLSTVKSQKRTYIEYEI